MGTPSAAGDQDLKLEAKRRRVLAAGSLSGDVKRSDGALRGLATGVITPLTDLRPCVVFGSAYPCWLPSLRQMGYRPVLVVLKEDTFLSEVEATVPDECAIWVGREWATLEAKCEDSLC